MTDDKEEPKLVEPHLHAWRLLFRDEQHQVPAGVACIKGCKRIHDVNIDELSTSVRYADEVIRCEESILIEDAGNDHIFFKCPIHGVVTNVKPIDGPGTEGRRFICQVLLEDITA